MKKGFFITLEGGEGCGKTTQSLLLREQLEKAGYRTIHTREPGGTALAESLRRLLLHPDNKISPLAELLMYEAARAQHVHELILPSLKEGKVIICDRFTDATIAYQGFGRGLDVGVIKKLNTIATAGVLPDMTIYLDLPTEQGLRKARSLAKESFVSGDRLEREAVSFHRRVRAGYRALAAASRGRIVTIATAPTVEETHRLIVRAVMARLKKKR
jgi:dTMP kinase